MNSKHLAAIAAIGTLGTSAMGQLLIDQFNAPPGGQLLVDFPGGGSAASSVMDPGIIGGSRAVVTTASGIGLPVLVGVNLTPNVLTIANPTDVSSITTITYDSAGAGLGDMDLAGAGFNAVEFFLEQADHPGTLTVDLFDGLTDAKAIVPLPVAPPAVAFLIPFGSFSIVGPGNPFASLDKIVLTFSAPAEADINIQSFDFTGGTVPETSTVFAMLGLAGVTGVTLYRRRRSA